MSSSLANLSMVNHAGSVSSRSSNEAGVAPWVEHPVILRHDALPIVVNRVFDLLEPFSAATARIWRSNTLTLSSRAEIILNLILINGKHCWDVGSFGEFIENLKQVFPSGVLHAHAEIILAADRRLKATHPRSNGWCGECAPFLYQECAVKLLCVVLKTSNLWHAAVTNHGSPWTWHSATIGQGLLGEPMPPLPARPREDLPFFAAWPRVLKNHLAPDIVDMLIKMCTTPAEPLWYFDLTVPQRAVILRHRVMRKYGDVVDADIAAGRYFEPLCLIFDPRLAGLMLQDLHWTMDRKYAQHQSFWNFVNGFWNCVMNEFATIFRKYPVYPAKNPPTNLDTVGLDENGMLQR